MLSSYLFFIVLVLNLAVAHRTPMHQPAGSAFDEILSDEPFRKLPDGDAGRRVLRIGIQRRFPQFLHIGQKAANFLQKPGFVEVCAGSTPMIETADQDGMLGEIDERARTKGIEQLAPADLTGGPRPGRWIYPTTV